MLYRIFNQRLYRHRRDDLGSDLLVDIHLDDEPVPEAGLFDIQISPHKIEFLIQLDQLLLRTFQCTPEHLGKLLDGMLGE